MEFKIITAILQEEFGLKEVSVKPLYGYANKNYLVDSSQGEFVFKTYPKCDGLKEIVDAENQLLLHLQSKGIQEIPQPIPVVDGTFLKVLTIGEQSNLCRLLTFVEGTFMGDGPLNSNVICALGDYAGQ